MEPDTTKSLPENGSLPQGTVIGKPASLRLSWVGAAFLFFFDAVLFLGFGLIISLLMAGISWLSALLRLLISKRQAIRLFAKGGIYILATALIFGVFHFNKWVGQKNSKVVIEALHAYKADHNTYPKELDELIPKYLDAVPLSAYRLAINSYNYRSRKETHNLIWANFPTGTFVYDLDTDTLIFNLRD